MKLNSSTSKGVSAHRAIPAWFKVTSCVIVGAVTGFFMLVMAIVLAGFGEGWDAGVMPSPLAGVGIIVTGLMWFNRTRGWVPLLLLPLLLAMLLGNLMLLRSIADLNRMGRHVADYDSNLHLCWMTLWIAWQVPAVGAVIVVVWHKVIYLCRGN